MSASVIVPGHLFGISVCVLFWLNAVASQGLKHLTHVLYGQVYNTGRSLEAFCALMVEKEGILTPPDVLITSVGTRVRCIKLAVTPDLVSACVTM